MGNKEYPRNDVEFVRIGYHDACINFLVTFRTYSREANRFADLKKAVHAAGEYNEFSPSAVCAAISQASYLVQTIQFGREGSPVMYLEINPGRFEGDKYVEYTSKELRAIELQVKGAFSDTRFDEWSRTGNTIRVWWD